MRFRIEPSPTTTQLPVQISPDPHRRGSPLGRNGHWYTNSLSCHSHRHSHRNGRPPCQRRQRCCESPDDATAIGGVTPTIRVTGTTRPPAVSVRMLKRAVIMSGEPPQEETGNWSGYPKHEGVEQAARFLRIGWGSRGSVRSPARKAGRVSTRSAGRRVFEGRGGKSLPSRPRAGSMPASGQTFDKRERRQAPPLALRSVSHSLDLLLCGRSCELADHPAHWPDADFGPTLGDENIDGRLVRLDGLDRCIQAIPIRRSARRICEGHGLAEKQPVDPAIFPCENDRHRRQRPRSGLRERRGANRARSAEVPARAIDVAPTAHASQQ